MIPVLLWLVCLLSHTLSLTNISSGTSYSTRLNYFTSCIFDIERETFAQFAWKQIVQKTSDHMCVYITQQVNMGQDFARLFPAITDHFTPPLLSMLLLSLAKRTWVEVKHGNGLRLCTPWRRSRFVCHMLHCAQVASNRLQIRQNSSPMFLFDLGFHSKAT